jgi:hypothetical protein
LRQLAHDGNRCRGCGISAAQLEELGWPPLQCHHINQGPPFYGAAYRREAVGVNLMTLCPDCHDGITDSVRRQRYRLSPKQQVTIVDVEARERSVFISRQANVIPSNDSSNTQREKPAVPQRSNRRSAQQLLQGYEGDQRQAKESGR